MDIKINKKPLIKEIKSKSPFTKRKKFDNKKLFKNRNIEESFLSGKDEEEQNKSFDYNMKDFNKKNRYMNMFNKNEELTSDLFSGLNMNFNNNNEQKESGEEAGYTGFNLMIDNNNNGNDEDSNIDEKIKELEEKIQKASDVSLYIF